MKILSIYLASLAHFLPLAFTTAVNFDATVTTSSGNISGRSLLTQPCTVIKQDELSSEKDPESFHKWLCKVHIGDRVLYGTKALLPIRGLSAEFLANLELQGEETELFSASAEILPDAIQFYPNSLPIVTTRTVKSSTDDASDKVLSEVSGKAKSKGKGKGVHPKAEGSITNAAPANAHLTYYGGPVIANVKVVTIWWGSNVQYTANLEQFYAGVTNSDWMRALFEYSTSTTTIGMGSWAQSYSCTSCATTGAGYNGAVLDSEIQTKLVSLITAGSVPAPTINTYYAIHFAPGINIDDGSGLNGLSCEVYCAYHGTLNNPTANKASVPYIYYGIMPDFGGKCSTGCGSSTTFNNLCYVSSHELAEMITDPAVGLAYSYASPLAWYDQNNGEITDICNPGMSTTRGSDGVTYSVATNWSNKANACIANVAAGTSPTRKPTVRKPTRKPTVRKPTRKPTKKPSKKPTSKPNSLSKNPTKKPSSKPSAQPVILTNMPSTKPVVPTKSPTSSPISSATFNLTISFMTDDYPKETYIDIYDTTTSTEIAYFAPGSFRLKRTGSTLVWTNLDTSHCYTIYMEDTYGDGFCCTYGSGWYKIYKNDVVVKSSQFKGVSSETTTVNC